MFAVDPDRHSGAAKWTVVAIAILVALACSALARRKWRAVLAGG